MTAKKKVENYQGRGLGEEMKAEVNSGLNHGRETAVLRMNDCQQQSKRGMYMFDTQQHK